MLLKHGLYACVCVCLCVWGGGCMLLCHVTMSMCVCVCMWGGVTEKERQAVVPQGQDDQR